MANRPPIRLPRQWPRHVKSGILHAISLASVVVAVARGRAASRLGLRAQLEQAETEIEFLREELLIKDGRWARSRSKRRPHYSPVQRMRVLQLRAARGWTLEKTARVFLVDLQTLLHWMRRLDEPGERPLIQIVEPVNRYPDFVRSLVRQLKCLCPAMGYERMARVLARVGLVLGATTIRRIVRERSGPPDDDIEVKARCRWQRCGENFRCIRSWFNSERPHTALAGKTPREICAGRRVRRQFEPRPKWPHGPRRRKADGDKVRLMVSYIENRKHLPVIEIRRAA